MKPSVRQVTDEYELWTAMFDYMADQLDGRFRLEFPNAIPAIDHLRDNLLNPWVRDDKCRMEHVISNLLGLFGSTLSTCMLNGCPQYCNHDFIREVINLVWDLRAQTQEWLRGNGIVPGFSAN